MADIFDKLMVFWKDIPKPAPSAVKDLEVFALRNKKSLPNDLAEYFIKLNGTNSEYDANFFRFYSLGEFKTIEEEFVEWNGLPDYSKALGVIPEHNDYYLFADYSFHAFAYAIKLYEKGFSGINEVCVISGGNYKQIAGSFTEFLELYIKDCSLVFL